MALITDTKSFLLVPAAEDIVMGGLNQVPAKVTAVPSSAALQFETPDYAGYTLMYTATPGEVTLVAPEPSGTIRGPYIYDPTQGLGVTAIEAEVATTLDAGRQYTSLELEPAFVGDEPSKDFPDSTGYLVFNFGREDQVGPVRYFGRGSVTSLNLDSGFRMPFTVEAGTRVIYLHQKTAFVPESPEGVGSLYVTASNAGLVAAQATLDEVVAAGVSVTKEIVYPGDRGLGAEGFAAEGGKLSDKVSVWGSDNLDEDLGKARKG